MFCRFEQPNATSFVITSSLSWRVSPVWWGFTSLMVPLKTCRRFFVALSQFEISKRFGRIASNGTCNLVLNERCFCDLWDLPAFFFWKKLLPERKLYKSIFDIHRHSFCLKTRSCWAHPCLRRAVELCRRIVPVDSVAGCMSRVSFLRK